MTLNAPLTVSSLIFLNITCMALEPIAITIVDDHATGYATFQSHNHKVVHTSAGIFTTHIRSRNDAYTAQQWRLSQSVDDGKSFTTLFEDTHATNPPPIEADSKGNLYLVRCDFVGGDAYLYRFAAGHLDQSPAITTIPGGAAGKVCLCLDEPRQQIYFFSHNNSFHVLSLDGRLKRSVALLKGGPEGILQYPLLALAGDGTLVAGWTTQKHGVYMYRSIQAMRSADGGETWTTLAGEPLSLPIIADETGPTDRISGLDELDVHTWLSNLVVHKEKIHFFYLAQSTPPKEHYLRYDLATGKREIDQVPFGGKTSLRIESLDGFFAADDTRLFAVGTHQSRLTCLVSEDAGESWADYAHGEVFAKPIYAVGGGRRVSRDGYIEGTFTVMTSDPPSTETGSTAVVHFFRIRAGQGAR